MLAKVKIIRIGHGIGVHDRLNIEPSCDYCNMLGARCCSGLRVAGYGLWVARYGLRVTGCGLRVAGCGLRDTSYGSLEKNGSGRTAQGKGLK